MFSLGTTGLMPWNVNKEYHTIDKKDIDNMRFPRSFPIITHLNTRLCYTNTCMTSQWGKPDGTGTRWSN